MSRKRLRPDFQTGLDYWRSVPATNNGVLGGFGAGTLPRVDALGTRTFLLTVMPELRQIGVAPRQRPLRGLDCGAGIGRVTATVLIHLCDTVDVVEPADHFLEAARLAAPSWRGIAEGKKAVRLFEQSLQQFDPRKPGLPTHVVGPYDEALEDVYDLIMIQWCVGHLSDPQLVAFLRKCRQALRAGDGSLICVKENLANGDVDDFDETDSSITRADATFRRLFEQAGLRLVKTQLQEGFADELLPVRMYALRP